MAEYSKFVWLDGKYLSVGSLPDTFLLHGFHYGSSAFEGIRAYRANSSNNKFHVFKSFEHFQRLENAARFLGWDDYPYSSDFLAKEVESLIFKNNLTDCYIRPIVFINDLSLKIATKKSLFSLMIFVKPWENFFNTNKHISVSLCPSLGPGAAWREVKLSAHYAYTLPFQLRAREQGFDDILRFNSQGICQEFSGANLGFIQNETVFLPSVANGLNGITKNTLIELCKENRIKVDTSKQLKINDIRSLEGLFSLGTATEICPISQVNDFHIESKTNTLIKELMSEYSKLTSYC